MNCLRSHFFLPRLESQDHPDAAAVPESQEPERSEDEEPALQDADRLAEMLSPKGVRHRGARVFAGSPVS